MQSTDYSYLNARPSQGCCEIVMSGSTRSALVHCGLTPVADWTEVESGVVGALAESRWWGYSGGRTIYSGRSQVAGFACEDSEQRRRRLVNASAVHDLVELDIERDIEAVVLANIPPAQRIVAWYGGRTDLKQLRRIAHRMMSVPARFYKIVPAAHQPLDGIAPLALLREHSPGRLIAYAAGAAGAWTRVLSAQFGSPLVYGAVAESGAEPGAISCERLRAFYGLPDRGPANTIYGIIGGAVMKSLAPWLHNRGLAKLGLPAIYLPFAEAPRDLSWVQTFRHQMRNALGLDFRGVTVTAPYKELAVRYVRRNCVSKIARLGQAANNLAWRGNRWRADSDGDWIVSEPIQRRGISLMGRNAAVVGCGGAGRAAAIGLQRAGARVTLINRGRLRGELVARVLKLPFVPLSAFSVDGFDLIVHATPAGKQGDPCLFPIDRLQKNAILLDLVYRETSPTQLVIQGREMGHTAIDGREVLCLSVAKQFEMLTGKTLHATALAPIVSASHFANDAAQMGGPIAI